MVTDDNRLDIVRGSLIGGAIGDALGYSVEFERYKDIIARYGKSGITEYELVNGVAEISDDTQMTLFTANGMLMGLTRWYMRGIGASPEFYVEYAYQDWYDTQTKTYKSVMEQSRHTWLSALPELYVRRAPGNTCLTAISEMKNRVTPQNESKGCGGLMRVAPWPLFCACHEVRYEIDEIDVAGGEIARLTHKHPLGWMPAIVFTDILYRLVRDQPLKGLNIELARQTFSSLVIKSFNIIKDWRIKNPISDVTWDKDIPFCKYFEREWFRLFDLISCALRYADNEGTTDEENIRKLGEGWVAEEALAIAIYAVARHIDSLEDVIIAAVNHDGDSDSTGSIAGNIMGAIVGYDAIPVKFKEHLELHDVILAIADDLCQGCIICEYDDEDTPAKRQWFQRYCVMMPAGIG